MAEQLEFYKETEFKETEIGRIPKEWKVARFQDLCQKLRSGGTPLTSKKEYYNGDIPFVKIEDITNAKKYLSSTLTTITKEGLNNSAAWLVPKYSLLLAIYGSLGSVAINTIELATNQAILGIILREMAETEFFYYVFSNLNLKKYAKRTTQANLTAEIIKDLNVPLPPLSEQQKIAEVLSTVDKKLDIERNEKSRLEHIKRGLMNLLLTGKVRVRVNN
ncbi:MAG: restriction endonuclease subunit S [Conexivisphaerales archaeon]